jgi:aspartate-semialdehyde dehydrogenase
MGYTVGIVGASGAVGKELRLVLENRDILPVDTLRLFGSARSAGTKIASSSTASSTASKFGELIVELFEVSKARECDVIFLAVSGSFALEHAKSICAQGGAVVIDNSVCNTVIRISGYGYEYEYGYGYGYEYEYGSNQCSD